MLIANLRNFLNKCKTHGDANFVTLKGGKFNIPSDKSQEFLDLYLKASTEFTESDNTSLVWRPTSERFKPLHFDIDLQLLTDVVIPNDIFIELASTICFYIISVTDNPHIGVLLTRKQKNYQAIIEKDGRSQTVFKTGMHMHCFGLLVTRGVALEIRTNVMDELESFCAKLNIYNSVDDVLDTHVSPIGKNGLLMLQDFKHKKHTGGNYYIFFRGTYNRSDCAWI